MNNSKTQRTPDEELLEELERALPWAQDNMPPSIVRWMLDALLQGTPDVQRPDDVTGDEGACWRRSTLYYLLTDDDFANTGAEVVNRMKNTWIGIYLNSRQTEEIRNYKQYEKKKTDE